MLKEFRDFAARGNVIELAVGVILGVAFGKVVTSAVDDLIMPPIGMAIGRVDFTNLFVSLNGQSLSVARGGGGRWRADDQLRPFLQHFIRVPHRRVRGVPVREADQPAQRSGAGRARGRDARVSVLRLANSRARHALRLLHGGRQARSRVKLSIVRPLIGGLITVMVTWFAGRAIGGVSASAIEEHRSQRRFGPGVCGPADPSYIRVSTETGGQPFFLSSAEVAKSAQIMSGSFLQSDLMLWASGDGEKSYAVAVDSSVERAMFSASFDTKGGTLTVISPQGTVFQEGERSEDTLLNCGRVITIEAPATGTWQLRVVPTGRFWLVARSKSALSLMAAEFVQAGGRPGHEGLFRIQGRPIAGKPATLRVRLSSEVKTATFGIVSLDAQPLQNLELKSLGKEEFVGTFTLPSEPFRVVVTGLDESGIAYQRIFATLFHAEDVEVIPPTDVQTLEAGAVSPVTFTIRNFGPSVRLNLVAVDGRGNVIAVEPSTLQLDQGAEGVVTVRLTPPPDAGPESRLGVTLTASSDGATPTSNYAVTEFTVVRR